MSRLFLAVTMIGLSLLAPGLVDDARADHRHGWLVGGGFSVGGLHFSVVFKTPVYATPVYYYRTPYRLSYAGYGCSAACFLDGGYYYHAAACPLVHHHFHRHRFHPGDVVAIYGPFHPGYVPYLYPHRFHGHRHRHHVYGPHHPHRFHGHPHRRHHARPFHPHHFGRHPHLHGPFHPGTGHPPARHRGRGAHPKRH